jgi:argininosuccinate lyase
LQNLQAALIDKAEENVKTLFPGESHNQLTQPNSFGHHLMGYVEMIGRDRSRIKDARKRLNESPYGSGEVAGNNFNLNRDMVSRILGFDKVASNSVDAINDRDYAVDFSAFASTCAMHLSRIAQDFINWHNTQNGYISFSEAFVVQSQVVPYKRDPEFLEVIRGQAGKIYGGLVNILVVLKGLNLSYSCDLEQVAEPVMQSYDQLLNSINTMAAAIADFKIDRKKMKEAASQSFSTALDLVDWLVQNADMSLSQAQAKSREIIEYAIEKGKKLSLLEINELKSFSAKITEDIYSVLIPSRAMISRRSGNGSNPVQIRKAIRIAKRNYL